MIGSLLLLFGIPTSSEYYIYACLLCACLVIFVMLEFLYLLSHLFLKLGGYK